MGQKYALVTHWRTMATTIPGDEKTFCFLNIIHTDIVFMWDIFVSEADFV